MVSSPENNAANAAAAPYAEDQCAAAAEAGNFPKLQQLFANGVLLTAMTTAMAAKNGNINILRWLFDNGCPRDSYVCASAAKANQLAALQCAHEYGECELTSLSRTFAKLGNGMGQFEAILAYLDQCGCPHPHQHENNIDN